MSLVCSLSSEVPDQPVVSPASGHVFERRLLEKYLETHGVDPISQEPLQMDQVLSIKSSSFVKPKAPQATSIPALLKSLQDEWDAVMLHSFTLRQQLQTARQELSHALYQHDAGCRVIARLSKELSAAREALATLKPQAAGATVVAGATTPQRPAQATEVGANNAATPLSGGQPLSEAHGVDPHIISRIEQKNTELTQERKKRAKQAPEGLATVDEIRSMQCVASHTGIHSASVPGILTMDVCQRDPALIVTGGNDKLAVVFNLTTEKNVAVMKGHTKKVTHTIYHPTDDIVVTASTDATVRVWSVEQARNVHLLRQHTQPVTGLALQATGDFILSVSSDAHWAFSDIKAGQLLVRNPVMDKSKNLISLSCAMFHPDGLLYGIGTQEGEVKIWDLKEFKNMANFLHAAGQTVTRLAFSENGYYLATGGEDGQVKLWDLRKMRNFKSINLSDEVRYQIQDMQFDYAGSYLAIAGTDTHIYHCKQWDLLHVMNDHTSLATAVRFGANARQVITASMDRSVKIYSV